MLCLSLVTIVIVEPSVCYSHLLLIIRLSKLPNVLQRTHLIATPASKNLNPVAKVVLGDWYSTQNIHGGPVTWLGLNVGTALVDGTKLGDLLRHHRNIKT